MAIFEGGGYGVVNWSGGRRHVTVFSENLSRTVFRGFFVASIVGRGRAGPRQCRRYLSSPRVKGSRRGLFYTVF